MILQSSDLPINQAAENNKAAILGALKQLGLTDLSILEIGSGTGQHGVYFCQHCPNIRWQPTEQNSQLPMTQQWFEAAQQANINNFLAPISYSVGIDMLPATEANAYYLSNVWHIMQTDERKHLCKELSLHMKPGDKLLSYGPFKREGMFTTDSNRSFEQYLKAQGYGGLIDIEDISIWSDGKLTSTQIVDMPANNFFLVYTVS